MVARGDARWGIGSERRRGVLGLLTSLAVGVLVASVDAQPEALTREQVTVILGSTRDLSGKNLAGLDPWVRNGQVVEIETAGTR